VPPPSGFPTHWTIDLPKVALLLRTADAANIDERRASGFLFALREPILPDFSRLHWRFQKKVSLAVARNGELVFGSNSPFSVEEANE
jgi:hypothetical protein